MEKSNCRSQPLCERNDLDILKIRAQSVKTLAASYNVSRRTIRRWLLKVPELGVRDGYYYTPCQVKKIYAHLGEP